MVPLNNLFNLFTLVESIESTLNQTFSDFELIIIDDGSTDDTLEIIRSFKDKRIRLIENNHDYIQSLNKGISESFGRYIARMDSDDIMLPNRLETQFKYMENNLNIDVCGAWMEVFGEFSSTTNTPIKHKEIQARMLLGNCISHPTIILRKESIASQQSYPNLYHPDFIYAEDYKLWVDLLMNGLHFANIPEVLLKYRVSENQNTSKYSKQMANVNIRIQLEYLEFAMGDIITKNKKFQDFLNLCVELFNKEQIQFKQLIKIVHTVYQEIIISAH